jgi:hypothetical protein
VSDITPVALFAHARPDLLVRTLEGLRANAVPLIYAFSDGSRNEMESVHVAAVRTVLHNIEWAEVVHVERPKNLGLYRSILTGVTHVFERHLTAIICEEDLLVAPGAYRYLTAALDHYRDDPRVFSVGAWTHTRVTPAGVGDQPYFSHRVNTLFWGAYAQSWQGMDHGSASERLARYAAGGGDPASYGADLPLYAAAEDTINHWDARFIADHLARGGLSLCPPWTMVEHLGYDLRATNARSDPTWEAPIKRAAPPIPSIWPAVEEHPEIAALWRRAVEVEMAAGQPRGWRARLRAAFHRLRAK